MSDLHTSLESSTSSLCVDGIMFLLFACAIIAANTVAVSSSCTNSELLGLSPTPVESTKGSSDVSSFTTGNASSEASRRIL